jgi:hypothetical protein
MSMVPNPTLGIRFNDCMFSEPVPAAQWTQPRYAGLFAVLVNDPDWAPKAFRPLHFGEFGNNSCLAALPLDYALLMATAQGRNLYVAVLPMPFSTTAQRRELRNELVWAYNPECQTGETAPANINQSFQPLPEMQRRRIGFMPQTEVAC